jgi:S-disulfanyl-L-cysteine oxidoreductase SoxD
MSRSSPWYAGLLALAFAAGGHAQIYGLGKPASAQEIAGWDIDVSPDGKGLPAGRGNAAGGKALYEQHCAACHGMKAEGKPADRLVGGRGTLNTDRPVMTVGSYWPYATTLYDYINRSMPFAAPQSLKPDEVYAISAYLLFLNGIIGETDVMDPSSLPKVQMPNRRGFVRDPRPDLHNVPCQVACRPD